MVDVKVEIVLCTGTACFVLGGSELLLVEERLPEQWRPFISIEASPCLGLCKERKNGRAPFAIVNGKAYPNLGIDELISVIGEQLGACDALQQ